MNNKNKTFLTKFLLATSSIGLLLSTESFAVDIAHGGVAAVHIDSNESWRYNNNKYFPQDKDNIILTAEDQGINFNKNINIGDINLYGYNTRGIVVAANYPDTKVAINNIVNINDNRTRLAVKDALGRAVPYGGNANSKVQITLKEAYINNQQASELTIIGNDISALDSVVLEGGGTKLIFQSPITIDAAIYAKTNNVGYIKAKDDIVFNKPIGFTDGTNHSISGLMISDNKSVTLKSDIYANDIELKENSKLIIDASKQNILLMSGVATDLFGTMGDGYGKIQISGNTRNTVTFRHDIGTENQRVNEIKIDRGKGTIFKSDVYAKKIIVGSNNVEFHEKLDMQHRDDDGNIRHIGNLEFTNYGEVKFHKDFNGNITTIAKVW